MKTQKELCYSGLRYATVKSLNEFIMQLIKKRNDLIKENSDSIEIKELDIIIEKQEEILLDLMFN